MDGVTLGDVVAAAVRAERARKRMSQRDLAAQLGWHPNTLADLEAGRRRPAVEDLPRLCRALGVDLLTLFFRADAEDLSAMGLNRPGPGQA